MKKLEKIENTLTSKELKKYLAEKFDVKVSKITSTALTRNCVIGEFVKDKLKYEFSYYRDEKELSIRDFYRVKYRRRTPFGYGGGRTEMYVSAENETAALEQAEAICKEEWGNICPCSEFEIAEW